MRALLVLGFLANLALALISLVVLPERVAVHFGADGVPDDWGSNRTTGLLMIALYSVLFAMLYLTPWLVARLPPRWVNLPHRDYWLRPEHRAAAVERLVPLLDRFGAALFGFLFYVGVLTLRANLAQPVRLDERAFLFGLAAFLGYTLYWIFALVRAFRLPGPDR